MGSQDQRSVGFVARDDRERLLEALAQLVAERGFADTTVTDVADRAGVDEALFETHFTGLENCLLAAYDIAAEQSFASAIEAFAETPGSWGEGANAALAALFAYIAHEPAFAYLATVEMPRLGERAVAHRDRSFDLFMEFLEPGYAEAEELAPRASVISRFIAGGIYELMRSHVVKNRIAALPEVLPEATLVMLAPFVGLEEARRIAGLEA